MDDFMLNRVLDFIEGQFVYCPRCLKRLPIRSQVFQDVPCEDCHFTIPLAYIRECKNAPPVFVQLFGLTATGKTTFLDMLRLHLYDLDRAWGASGFYAQPITQLDMDHKTILLTERSQGVMPRSTTRRGRNQNEVYIMYLRHMPRWGSRFLVLMDHAGEQFGKLIIDVAEIPFLQHTPVTIVLLSLPDLVREGNRVDELITSYIASLEQNGVNFAKERRQLIIVFSKADLIPNLPPELHAYLSGDTLYMGLGNPQQTVSMGEAEVDNYIARMSVISNIIKGWVKKEIQGGAAMLHMLNDKGIETRFAVMSATGHQLTPGTNVLAPTPRRVLDPYFWVLEYYKHLGPQNVIQANVGTILATFSPALRRVGSLASLILLFFCTLGGGLYASQVSQGSSEFVGFCLSLVLLFVCTLINRRMGKNNPIARSILNTTRLALFLSCVALQTSPSVQQVFSQLTLYQLLALLIVGTALFSCFQPAAHLSRITLATIAGIGALLQYTYGALYELPVLPFIKLDTYTVLNYILIGVLLTGAIIALLLSTEERIWVDRAILFVIAPVYGAFQLVYGSQALVYTFPFMNDIFKSPQGIDVFNNVLVFFVSIILPLCLLFLYRFPRLDRVPLLILAVVCAYLLNFLGSSINVSVGPVSSLSLDNQAVDLLAPDRIVGYSLVVMGALIGIRLLFTRFPENFTLLDHVALFLTAFVCAQLQMFPWGNPTPQGNFPTLQGILLHINQFVASSLTLLTFFASGVALVLLLLPLARQFWQVERIVQAISGRATRLTHLSLWLERITISATAAGCALLAELYGPVGPVPFEAFSVGGTVITWYQIVALLFTIFAIISLCRLTRPLMRGDRSLLLINIVFCTAFYFLSAAPLIPLSSVLQGWNEGAYHSHVPDLLFSLLLVWIAFISFWWPAHSKFSGDRRLLQIIFGLALVGGLLQLLTSSLLFTLLVLLALIMGVVVARIVPGSTV